MSNKAEKSYQFGHYQLDTAQRVLRRNGEIVPLPLKSLEVLLVLVERHGRVVSKEEIIEQVWRDCFVDEANLARHIYTLRRTLSQENGTRPFIQTLPSRGYHFAVEVRVVAEARENEQAAALVDLL